MSWTAGKPTSEQPAKRQPKPAASKAPNTSFAIASRLFTLFPDGPKKSFAQPDLRLPNPNWLEYLPPQRFININLQVAQASEITL
jgi:hypothetical protein